MTKLPPATVLCQMAERSLDASVSSYLTWPSGFPWPLECLTSTSSTGGGKVEWLITINNQQSIMAKQHCLRVRQIHWYFTCYARDTNPSRVFQPVVYFKSMGCKHYDLRCNTGTRVECCLFLFSHKAKFPPVALVALRYSNFSRCRVYVTYPRDILTI